MRLHSASKASASSFGALRWCPCAMHVEALQRSPSISRASQSVHRVVFTAWLFEMAIRVTHLTPLVILGERHLGYRRFCRELREWRTLQVSETSRQAGPATPRAPCFQCLGLYQFRDAGIQLDFWLGETNLTGSLPPLHSDTARCVV